MARPVSHLLIIDPQNDFCDLPASYCPAKPDGSGLAEPALPVPGAHADLVRLAGLVGRSGQGFDQIFVTLDSHHYLDIAHPTFWQTAEGQPVAPFTQVRAADLRAGRLRPRRQEDSLRALAYLEALEQAGRYVHMIWPVHCEIGSWGHGIHADLHRALHDWENRRLRNIDVVVKGTNPWTEHFSAIQAEVPDPDDSASLRNTALIEALAQADRIIVAGEAGSHCVRASVEHLVEALGKKADRLILVTDCISPVTGFEAQYEEFLDAMRRQGLRCLSSSAVEAELGYE